MPMSNDIHPDSPDYLKLLVDAYLACAATVSHDTGPDGTEYESLDNYGGKGWHESAVKQATEACAGFIHVAKQDLIEADITVAQAGTDLWLTSNHHGAGFWDRGLGDVGDRLTKHAHAHGSSEPYIGDDGYLYL